MMAAIADLSSVHLSFQSSFPIYSVPFVHIGTSITIVIACSLERGLGQL